MLALTPDVDLTVRYPKYSPEDLGRANQWGFEWSSDHPQDPYYRYSKEGWIYNGQEPVSEHLLEDVINLVHQSTNYGRDATLHWIQEFIIGPNMQRTIQK